MGISVAYHPAYALWLQLGISNALDLTGYCCSNEASAMANGDPSRWVLGEYV